LDDPDPDLRVAAANAVAGRAGAVRFKRTAQMENEWRQDVETLRAFRPRLWRALDDPNEQVRLAAILALGNLEYQGQERDGNIALGLELLTRLAALYEGEPTLLVRVEIAKTFALTSTDAPVRWNTLEVMLRDPAADVQQYAVVGVARSRSPETGARLLPLLASESRAVRMNAVQAIAMRGEESRAYVDDLRRMLSVETDLAVAKTIKGAITSLERER
jgi:HEAT repeat protein